MLPVTVVEHRRARRLTLRIVPGGRSLRLTTPPDIDDRHLDRFLQRNRAWVAARIARMPQPVSVRNGAVIPYIGTDHRIEHEERDRGNVTPAMDGAQPVLRIRAPRDSAGRRLKRFFVAEARQRLGEAVERHSASLGVRPRAIRLADTSSRWGSCSTTRTLSFSWRIVMAPAEVLDYLAAHETAHLREMNHSDRFWSLVDGLCPEMERQKHWLRKNGPILHAVNFD